MESLNIATANDILPIPFCWLILETWWLSCKPRKLEL